MKVYRGSPAAALNYVEAGRSRADDYYLAESTGVADRYVASPEGVRHGGTLTGDAYEMWVAGCDPHTGAPKGRLRSDDQAVRFVEVVVNGPKSWSLAAALHSDIAAAHDAAQDRAAVQIIGWLAQHATTRVGPRGRQVQVPVHQIEAVTVRHYTSRAGDPHRHLHLQVNSRVFAESSWRGLHTVGVRDSLDAINGIGHAAVMCDPQFRDALAAHRFTLDPTTGEVVELAGYVGPFSARAAQIGRNVDSYEAQWRAVNPGAEPDRRLRRSWDARAWAQARPDKVVPTDGADLTARWVQELHGLGYRDPNPSEPIRAAAVASPVIRVGTLDRDLAVGDVVVRLGVRRSGWNAADVRGEVERLIASTGIVTDAPARLELAEDLTARAVDACVPLLARRGLPGHIRALTSQHVVDVEADLTTRFIVRAQASTSPMPEVVPAASLDADGLDVGQGQVIAAIVGRRRLLVVEGAAGAGKTTTLTAARAALERQGQRLLVVTPTLKAATVAADQVGAPAFSAAWLAHQHGHRWDNDGRWTRLRVGDTDQVTGINYRGPRSGAVLTAGDLLLVDEAGMLDQDTAHAVMVIADENRARVALVGDRHQLPAVGRGGVLDLAARWAHPNDCLTLDTVHRFRDPQYAQLSLAMRIGHAPGTPDHQLRGGRSDVAGEVFDALVARNDVHIYATETERTSALAEIAATATTTLGKRVLLADTREQVTALNASVRDQLIAGGQVDDTAVVTTWAGERIGVGDQVATRRNDHDAGVANRDIWTVTGLRADGALTVAGKRGERVLSAGYALRNVELAYATTVYGAQGATTNDGHLALGEHTGAGAAYVAMTRGRDSNTVHIVADTLDEARDQWVDTFSRDRADLGPTHAAHLAGDEASRYATHRPLEAALADLREAWTVEQTLTEQLTAAQRQRGQLTEIVPLRADHDAHIAVHATAYRHARGDAEQTRERADQLDAAVDSHTNRIADRLHQDWNTQRPAARTAAKTFRAGTGRFGQHRSAVRRAGDQLDAWAQQWRPIVAFLPTNIHKLSTLAQGHDGPGVGEAITTYARRTAQAAHPESAPARATADTARRAADRALTAYEEAYGRYPSELAAFGSLAYIQDPPSRLAHTEQHALDLNDQLKAAQHQVRAALAEPAIRSLPHQRIQAERDTWAVDREQQRQERDRSRRAQVTTTRPSSGHHHVRDGSYPTRAKPSPGIGP